MAWRLARSLVTLRVEVNQRWPNRSKVSDGTVGDAEHSTRASDHNPNSAGVVRALDITADGIDAGWYAEHLRMLGAGGHPALRGYGYVIFDGRTAGATNAWRWKPYTGPSKHTHHIHVSVGRDPAQYDSTAPWWITNSKDDPLAALSDTEQRELLSRVRATENHAAAAAMLATSVDQRCARLEASVHGTDDKTRADSIWWKVRYLYGEVLDGDNAARLRVILRKFGVS
jgi:hypothetical protein